MDVGNAAAGLREEVLDFTEAA